MVSRAGGVQGDHAADKHGQRYTVDFVRVLRRLDQQRGGGKQGHHHADEVGNRAAGIFNLQFHNNTSVKKLYIVLKTIYTICKYYVKKYKKSRKIKDFFLTNSGIRYYL